MTAPDLLPARTRRRNPSLAANLSLVSVGLGHLYVGDIARGFWFLFAFIVAVGGFALTVHTAGGLSGSAILFLLGGALLVPVSAAWDARRLACRTRIDYRLKDYNCVPVYVLFAAVGSLAVAVGLVLLVRAHLVEAFRVPGRSMAPTISAGDHVLADKTAYRTTDPGRGDLVIFRNPENRRQSWIKRVVAIGGDSVAIAGNRSVQVYRAGEGNAPTEGTVVVPANHLFVMGDNPGASRDSRDFGPISVFSVTGQAVYRHWPPLRLGKLSQP